MRQLRLPLHLEQQTPLCKLAHRRAATSWVQQALRHRTRLAQQVPQYKQVLVQLELRHPTRLARQMPPDLLVKRLRPPAAQLALKPMERVPPPPELQVLLQG